LALRRILTIDDNEAELRRKCRPVEKFDGRLAELLDDLVETMHAQGNGAGLAAPQVGVLRRVAVIDVGCGVVELVNPEILETSGAVEVEEGCLSLPGRSVHTLRPAWVKARTFDRTGKEQVVEGDEMLALALAHEIGHLNGELLIDFAIDEVLDDEESGG
jgi:peptide deformylase